MGYKEEDPSGQSHAAGRAKLFYSYECHGACCFVLEGTVISRDKVFLEEFFRWELKKKRKEAVPGTLSATCLPV